MEAGGRLGVGYPGGGGEMKAKSKYVERGGTKKGGAKKRGGGTEKHRIKTKVHWGSRKGGRQSLKKRGEGWGFNEIYCQLCKGTTSINGMFNEPGS